MGEEDLIERARRRDPHAWAEIYELYSASIFGFLYHQVGRRELAEDLAGGVFLEALKASERFQGTVADMRSWLFRITRNNLIDHYRRDRRIQWQSIDEASYGEVARAAPPEDPEEEALAGLQRKRLVAAVNSLSEDQKEVLLLRLTGDLTSPEIAEITGRSLGAVKALQHRGVKALTRIMSGDAPESEEGGDRTAAGA